MTQHTDCDKQLAETRIGGVGRIALVALVAALMQSVLIAVVPGAPGLQYFDDAATLLLVVAAISRLSLAPGMAFTMLVSWALLMLVGAAQTTVDPGTTFVLFRQVTIPALLILVGLTVRTTEWRVIRRVAIWVGLLNLAYMVVEQAGVRPLNPLRLLEYGDQNLWVQDGLPGYYFYYGGGFISATYLIRLGGLVLNPPIAGIVTGTALVFLWYQREFRFRRLLLVAMSAATVLTLSRAGWLIVLAGILLPFLMRTVGRVGAVLIAVPAAAFVGTQLADDGKSNVHADGLFVGVEHAFQGLFGLGFGSAGNFLKARGDTMVSESLLGIAFSAAGVLAIVVVVLLLVKLFNALARDPGNWEAALSIGLLCAAGFSETAGALNGTIPLWLAAGFALRKDIQRCLQPRLSARPGAEGTAHMSSGAVYASPEDTQNVSSPSRPPARTQPRRR